MKTNVEDESGSVLALMKRAQDGDRVAFDELQQIGEARGISYTEGWSAQMVLFRLQDRASPKNLLARVAVQDDLAAAIHDLSDSRDGPIERMLVERAALWAIDARMADYEHLWSIRSMDDPADAEVYDRRRDRANKRLLSTLKVLIDARRTYRVTVQINIGECSANRLKA